MGQANMKDILSELESRRGSARLYQVLATRSAKEPAPKPPTRDDIYAAPVPYKRQVK